MIFFTRFPGKTSTSSIVLACLLLQGATFSPAIAQTSPASPPPQPQEALDATAYLPIADKFMEVCGVWMKKRGRDYVIGSAMLTGIGFMTLGGIAASDFIAPSSGEAVPLIAFGAGAVGAGIGAVFGVALNALIPSRTALDEYRDDRYSLDPYLMCEDRIPDYQIANILRNKPDVRKQVERILAAIERRLQDKEADENAKKQRAEDSFKNRVGIKRDTKTEKVVDEMRPNN